ncbi:hypothetical protein Tco_1228249 [Tanacetum coccineum]
MCRQPLPPPLSPPSAKLMIMALEEYGYQSRRGIRDGGDVVNGGDSLWKDDGFGVDVLRFHTCLTDILGFLEKFGWWFEQDIDDEGGRMKRVKMMMRIG